MKRGPSDGEIYEAVSRKANPELFAAVDEAIAKTFNRLGSETVPRMVKVNGNRLQNGDPIGIHPV